MCCALQCIVIEALSIVLLHCLARGDCFFSEEKGVGGGNDFFFKSGFQEKQGLVARKKS